METCVLVNCFASSNEMRVEPIREYFDKHGYQTIYIASDFHHTKKEFVKLSNNIIPVHTKPYKKNLSVSRMYSHYAFSNAIYEKLCEYKPTVIYIKFPPNSLVKMAYKYRKANECKLILDVFDLWPESLPVSCKIKNIISPATALWASFRNKYLRYSDLVFTECDMYKDVLKDYLPNEVHTLYLTKNDISYVEPDPKIDSELTICYLGGINNLIDIDMIGKIICQLTKNRKVTLEIIGDGIKRDELIMTAKESGARVNFHGVIYDEQDKYLIMSKCDYGLNLMKKTVKVALTIKSIEYFRAGIAIINNVPYDTWNIIERYNAGINIVTQVNKDFSSSDIIQMKRNARKVYEVLFSRDSFERVLEKTL